MLLTDSLQRLQRLRSKPGRPACAALSTNNTTNLQPMLPPCCMQVMTLWQCSILLAKCHPHFPDLISVVSHMIDVAQQQQELEVELRDLAEAGQQQVPPGGAT
jgi:hypothetical protein